jgi:hypothetical protein
MRNHRLIAAGRKSLDWLDRQPGFVFWLVLYLTRWPVIIPVSWLQGLLGSLFLGAAEMEMTLKPHVGMLVFPPLLETFIECTLPYWILSRMKRIRPGRPWGFICISGIIMALLHFPYALPCGFVTGVFLAYCYAHFAARSQWRAFAATALYHAAINAVGFVLLSL